MLRRRPDDTFEFRQVEAALFGARPRALSPAAKEALRLRIMARLGAQEEVYGGAFALRERWVAIPAGMGIAAAILAAVHIEQATAPDTRDHAVVAQARGDVLIDGEIRAQVLPGQVMEARSNSWVAIGEDLRLGLSIGARASYTDDVGLLTVRVISGDVTVVSGQNEAQVVGEGWSGWIAAGSAVTFALRDGMVFITIADGEVTLNIGGRTVHLTGNDGPTAVPIAAPPTTPPPNILPGAGPNTVLPPVASEQHSGLPESHHVDAPADSVAVVELPAASGDVPPAGAEAPVDEPADKPAPLSNEGGIAVPPGHAKPEGSHAAQPTPPSATPTPPAATPAPPAAERPGNAIATSNVGGNGNLNAGPGISNAGGNGNPNAGPGNSNAGGNGNPNAGSGNSNAGGNGNPNAGPGNSNAGGNGNPNAGPGNSNAGGNGNPNAGPGNSNAGGNGNGKPPRT